MSDKVIQLTAANFDQVTAKGIVLIDFWAPWCGPCRMMGPILDDVAAKLGDKAVIAKVNVDDEAALASRFQVRSIPMLALMKDGGLVKQWVGVQQSATLVDAVSKA
jgi:thioredoxin 1